MRVWVRARSYLRKEESKDASDPVSGMRVREWMDRFNAMATKLLPLVDAYGETDRRARACALA